MKIASPAALLDDGLDELAVSAHAGFFPRVAINAATAGVFSLVLPWQTCLFWASVTVGLEVQAWFATRRQFLKQPVGWRTRLWHAAGLGLSTLAWVALGAMAWSSGSIEGALCAVVIWLAVIFFAQTNAYQSSVGFVLGGAIPGAVVVAVVLLAPHAPHLKLTAFAATLMLGFLFAGDGVARMLKARRRLTETQARLAHNEMLYRVLADNVTDVISMADINGKRLYMSPSVERALGYPIDELYQMPMYTFIHPDDREKLTGAVAEIAANGGGDLTTQYRVIRADGAVVWIETSFTLAGGEDGGTPYVISVARNIQRRKELEFELIGARVAAEAAVVAKSDFLANMTHELRTPLNAIIGFAGVLKDSPRLEGADARHARLICDASGALLDLVNSVLDFSRLEAGAVELDPVPFDPAVEAASVVELLSGQAAAKGLALSLQAEGEGLVSGDAKQLRQVWLNFLSNAVKFTAEGAVTLTLTQTPAGEGRVRLRAGVSDTGVGIPPAQIEHVFERFTQADVSVSRRFGGTGLGLAICKRIVELMGGQIGATSVEGEGSTFWFEVTLPVAEAAETAAKAEPAVALERPVRLLLVEDVAINRELVKTVLAPFDIEIDTAEDGVAAIAAFQQGAYDLVLMDVQMPVMDGLTATRHIRALSMPAAAATPIIAMTANVLPDQIAKCVEAGMDGHLGKPMSPADLLSAIAHWTSHERAPAEANAATAA
jgi:PAS domain S-box-containing protein